MTTSLTNLPPRVSVVMPIFDAARYLSEAIESVRAQTFRDWELVLVDDGSRDGSAAIARDYAEREPERIHYLDHPGHVNLGSSASRNRGAAEARGEWIAFLDADDVWLPAKLERQLALVARHPRAAMIYNPTLQWYSWTGRAADRARDRLYDLSPLVGRLIEPPEGVPLFAWETVPCPCTCSFLIRRSAYEAVGGSEASFRGMYDDQVLVMKLHLRYPVYVGAECLDRYRIREDSIYQTALQQRTVAAARLRFLDWLNEHLLANGWNDDPFLNLLAGQRFRLRHPRLGVALARWPRVLRALAARRFAG